MAESQDMISKMGGLDIEMHSEKMEKDPWADKMLREIGKSMVGKEEAKGLEYVGSFAIHMVRETSSLTKDSYTMASITQICCDDVTEQFCTLAFNNAVIALRKYYDSSFRNATARKGDNR